jgi:hypothetical protein
MIKTNRRYENSKDHNKELSPLSDLSNSVLRDTTQKANS